MADPQAADSASEGDKNPRSLSWLFLVIAGALCMLVLARMEQVGTLVQRLALPALAASVEAIAAVGFVGVLRRLLSRGAPPPVGESLPGWSFGHDLLIGGPLFGTFCYLVGLIRVSSFSMGSLVLVFFALGVWRLRASARAPLPACSPGALGTVALGLLGIALGMSVLQAQLPACSLDELAYHLAVPRAWVIEGRVISLPLNSQSFYPAGTESLDLPLLTLLGPRGANASHVLHLFLAIATCLEMYRFLARHMSGKAALIGVAAAASTPALLMTAGWSWNDWPLLGVCVACMCALERWASQPSTRDSLAALALPAAAGLLCKYTFVAFALAATLSALLTSARDAERRRTLLRAMGVAALLGSVFYLRNAIVAHNPFEPFLGAASPKITGFRSADRPEALFLSYIFDEGVADESLGGALLALALGLVLSWRHLRRHPLLLRLGFSLLLALLIVALLGPSARILVPFLAGAGLIGLVGLEPAFAAIGPRAYSAMLLLTLLLAGLQTTLTATLTNSLHPYNTLVGKTPDRTFMLNFADGHTSYPRVEWIDQLLPDDSKTLIVGLHQLYYFSHRVRGGGDFDGSRVARYLAAPSPAALRERLSRDGFTHLAVFRPRLVDEEHASKGLRAELETMLPKPAYAAFQAFLAAHGQLLASDAGIEVYALH